MGECLITHVLFNKQKVKPTNIKFQNGQLLKGKEQELSCGLFIPEGQNHESNSITPVLASESLIYSGEVQPKKVYDTYIMIRNRKTNKTKLVAIDEALLKPIVPQQRAILDSSQMEMKKSAITDLNKEFGSKKIKRVTDQMERYKTNVDNFKEQLEKTIANVDVNEEELVETVQQSEYLPPINANASKPNAVYSLDQLVPSNVIASLKKSAENILNIESDDLQLCNHVKKQVEIVQKSKPDNYIEQITKLLILDAFINIYSNSAKSIGHRNYEPSAYSKLLSTFTLDTFTVKSEKTRMRPFAMKDKVTCYIIVLSVLIKDLKVNLTEVSSFLNLSVRKVQQLCRMLRLHVKETSATLSLPLPAPISPQKSKTKGRK